MEQEQDMSMIVGNDIEEQRPLNNLSGNNTIIKLLLSLRVLSETRKSCIDFSSLGSLPSQKKSKTSLSFGLTHCLSHTFWLFRLPLG